MFVLNRWKLSSKLNRLSWRLKKTVFAKPIYQFQLVQIIKCSHIYLLSFIVLLKDNTFLPWLQSTKLNTISNYFSCASFCKSNHVFLLRFVTPKLPSSISIRFCSLISLFLPSSSSWPSYSPFSKRKPFMRISFQYPYPVRDWQVSSYVISNCMNHSHDFLISWFRILFRHDFHSLCFVSMSSKMILWPF